MRVIPRMEKTVDQVVKHSTQEEAPVSDRFINTGLGLWNLALSNNVNGGFLSGKIANVIGDSSSGKTFLCLSLLAEVANTPAFDDYDLIYDDAEESSEFDLVKLFGQKTAERILPPSGDRDDPQTTHTMLDFQANVRKRLKGEKPFIYVLDSFDAVTTKEELAHADDLEKAREKGTEAKGTYGMEKAKQASILLRMIVGEIKDTKSLLIIISQTRDNIDPMSFQPKTRAGGKALKFYSSYEMWLAVEKKLTEKVGDKNYAVGVLSKIKVTKNKGTGKPVSEVSIPIYYSYGADDIGSCVDFLVSVGEWKKSSGIIQATGLKLSGYRNKVIGDIEAGGLTDRLHLEVHKAWMKIEKALKPDRVPRYSNG